MVVGDLSTGTEVLVIGAGPGGYVAAIRASQLGKEVTLIDKGSLGGICLHHGCIPSKALIHAADFFHKIKHAEGIGILTENVSIDIAKTQEWKKNVIATLTNGIEMLCKRYNVKVINGNAFFESPTMVKVLLPDKFMNIEFQNAIIATGSVPIEAQGFEFDGKVIISSNEALEISTLPKDMVVIGGGYIGLELGTVFAKLGSSITIVEYEEQILPGIDKDVVSVIVRNLEKLGVRIYTGYKAEKCEVNGSSAVVTISSSNGTKLELSSDKVLVAIGRKPNTCELKLENTRVDVDEKGFIKVDNMQRTSDRKIFAIGDVANHPMLAHKATRQAKVAAEIIAGKESSYDNLVVPAVIFTDPEVAIAGLTENEATTKGYEIKVGKFPLSALGRSLTVNQKDGFVKVIADKKTEVVLGIVIVGYNASDIIGEAGLAIELGATLDDIALTIHAHPTFPESLMEAAEAAKGVSVHLFGSKQ